MQRLGHLLEHLGHDALTGSMLAALQARGSLPWTELDRQEARDPDDFRHPVGTADLRRSPRLRRHRAACARELERIHPVASAEHCRLGAMSFHRGPVPRESRCRRQEPHHQPRRLRLRDLLETKSLNSRNHSYSLRPSRRSTLCAATSCTSTSRCAIILKELCDRALIAYFRPRSLASRGSLRDAPGCDRGSEPWSCW